jgi:hypothetical protein
MGMLTGFDVFIIQAQEIQIVSPHDGVTMDLEG